MRVNLLLDWGVQAFAAARNRQNTSLASIFSTIAKFIIEKGFVKPEPAGRVEYEVQCRREGG
jgi:hypothetical protein